MKQRRLPSGLIVADFPESPEVHAQRLSRLQQAWDNLHRCCPQCGAESIERTCMGHLGIADNVNRATCACGWRGKVCDLVRQE
jgi:hypothetical protein